MRFAAASFRPTFGRVLTIVLTVISALGLAAFVVTGDVAGLLRYGWGLLLLAALGFALYWFPRLDVAEHEITVRNVFSTTHVPWTAIQRIDTKYALTLYTAAGKVTSWASPAPNRYAAQNAVRGDARLASDAMSGGAVRPGDLPFTSSGAAAFVIRHHLDDLVESGRLQNAVVEEGSQRREIHWATIILLGALLLATVLGFVL